MASPERRQWFIPDRVTPILSRQRTPWTRWFPKRQAAPRQYLGVAIDLRAVRAVVLPGTGSDDDYITRAFGGPLRDAGATLLAPPPQPTRLIGGYLSELADAAREGPIVVGGVSIGAAVAAAPRGRPRPPGGPGRGAAAGAAGGGPPGRLPRRNRGTVLGSTAA